MSLPATAAATIFGLATVCLITVRALGLPARSVRVPFLNLELAGLLNGSPMEQFTCMPQDSSPKLVSSTPVAVKSLFAAQ